MRPTGPRRTHSESAAVPFVPDTFSSPAFLPPKRVACHSSHPAEADDYRAAEPTRTTQQQKERRAQRRNGKLVSLSITALQFKTVATFARTWGNQRQTHVLGNVATSKCLIDRRARHLLTNAASFPFFSGELLQRRFQRALPVFFCLSLLACRPVPSPVSRMPPAGFNLLSAA